jgi:ADP-ribosyl-[dinitrogen reductase] hydrolase
MRDAGLLDDYGDSLSDDLQRIKSWGAAALVTLLDDSELKTLGVLRLGEKVCSLDMVWLHLPFRNRGNPDSEFVEIWRKVVPGLCKLLRNGQHVVMHCREGVNRTGLAAACLLIELGLPAREAVRTVRNSRPGSLLYPSHEEFCYSYQPSDGQAPGHGVGQHAGA